MTEDLNQRLEQAAQGITPQTKPDERRQYLGSLRERVLVRMQISDVSDPQSCRLFLQHLNDYQAGTVLINGKMPQNKFISDVMSACSKNGIKFTLISDETALTAPQATGILVVASSAINRYRIEIKQVYAPDLPVEKIGETPKPKKGFLSRLFHRGKN